MERKKKAHNASSVHSLDFGSKSAENKAVSVLLLSADLGFVLRFC